MTAVVIDDHLLRDVLSGQITGDLRRRLRGKQIATTNMYYVRLCKSAVSARGGSLTGSWPAARRVELARSLFALPDEITVVQMRVIAFRMAELTDARPLSMLGAEAVAAAEHLDSALVVWSGDDGQNSRAAARSVGVRYHVVVR